MGIHLISSRVCWGRGVSVRGKVRLWSMIEAARLLDRSCKVACKFGNSTFFLKRSAGWRIKEQKTYLAHLDSEGCGDHR